MTETLTKAQNEVLRFYAEAPSFAIGYWAPNKLSRGGLGPKHLIEDESTLKGVRYPAPRPATLDALVRQGLLEFEGLRRFTGVYRLTEAGQAVVEALREELPR